jgi:hypothetical protein
VTANPLTAVLEAALAIVEEREAAIFSAYGVPLFTDLKSALDWPADPEMTSPETMAVLIQTRGDQAVNNWLADFYTRKAEGQKFAIDKLTGKGAA